MMMPAPTSRAQSISRFSNGMRDDLGAGLRRQLGAFGLDHRHAFLQREERALVAVDRHADHQPVDELAGALDDVDMPEGDGIERPGIKPCSHCRPYPVRYVLRGAPNHPTRWHCNPCQGRWQGLCKGLPRRGFQTACARRQPKAAVRNP
jgi:hypothetical protein